MIRPRHRCQCQPVLERRSSRDAGVLWRVPFFAILLSCSVGWGQTTVAPSNAHECPVSAYGAIGDGKTLNTTAINAAVADCHASGGGKVVVGAGVYRTGTIQLLDNITLVLAPGSTLLGSENLADYPHLLAQGSEERDTALILAQHAHNVAIVGPGTIDGNGRAFEEPGQNHWAPFFVTAQTRQGTALEDRMRQAREGPVEMKARPGTLVLILDSDGIALRDFHVADAPNWNIHVACSDHIAVRGLDVRNSLLVPNTDGLDISASRNATISDSLLEAGDDGLVVGGPTADGWCRKPAENIAVNNLIVHSRSSAIRIGPAARGARSFTFENIVIEDSNRGINIQARNGELVENLLFSNVVSQTRLIDGPWWGAGEPISITAANWDYGSWPKTQDVGHVRHVKFSNMIARSESPIVVYSVEPGGIEGVDFSGVDLTMQASELQAVLGGNLDLQPITPRSLGLIRHDLSAILAHNVKDLTLDHINVGWDGDFPPFYRYAVEVDGYDGLNIEQFRGQSAAPTYPALRLRNGKNLSIDAASGADRAKTVNATAAKK
jgi:hypothetical protein